MKIRKALLWAWLILPVFLVYPGRLPAAQRWSARVRWVVDGDTFILNSGQKIRLKGIDAPELAHDRKPEQYYAREAKGILQELVQGKKVFLEARTMQADRFGRLVAYVWLLDGRLLNQVLLERGSCFCFPHGQRRDVYWRKMLAAQRQAMARGRGVWPRILSLSVARRHYVGSKKSFRFHTLSCSYGRRISWKNRVDFFGLREAFYAGYAPGRCCTPWPRAVP